MEVHVMKNAKSLRYVYLFTSMLTFLFAGIIYAWSTIKAPFTEEFGWQGGTLALTYTLTMIFFCLGGLVSGLLSKKLSSRIRMTIAALALIVGFFIVSRLQGESILPLYLGYGFLAGTGIGFVYNTVIAVTGAWFPDKKGLCSGCLMMAFGFSALVVGSLMNRGFSPTALGWRNTYLVMGCISGAVIFLDGLFLRLPKPEELPPRPAAAVSASDAEDYTPEQMLRRASFYKLFAFFTLLSLVGSTVISLAREVLSCFGDNGVSMTVGVVGFISICNGIGRLISGACFDGLGLRRTQYVTSAVSVTAPLIVWLALVLQSLPLGIAGLLLCGVSYGFSPTVTVAFANTFYGSKHFAANLPILNLVLIPASLLSALVATFPSLQLVFLLLTILSCVGLVINISIRKA